MKFVGTQRIRTLTGSTVKKIWSLCLGLRRSFLIGLRKLVSTLPKSFSRSRCGVLRRRAGVRTILADPPWRFNNKTGKIAPEHHRLARYSTMTLDAIERMPIESVVENTAHLYLWCPNALLPDGLAVMRAWGFNYKSNLIWHKIRKDGGPDGRGVGFYFRNVTEIVLFGVRGKKARTLDPARRQVNLLATRKREHSRNPDELYDIIEACR